jgi:hypothetical protein
VLVVRPFTAKLVHFDVILSALYPTPGQQGKCYPDTYTFDSLATALPFLAVGRRREGGFLMC